MIYELSLVAKSELSDEQVTALQDLVGQVVGEHQGEVLVKDDWGTLTFAQPTSNGVTTGRFLFFVFKANNQNNVELARRFRINEGIIKHLVVKVGEEKEQEVLLKSLKTPFSKSFKGSVTDTGDDADDAKDSRKFARRRTCWFTANKFRADWKDPATFLWLVNEFGKISPARISGISRKHQLFARTAIMQARQLGIASYISNSIAE
jgi:small subunit ribosomal protein S6